MSLKYLLVTKVGLLEATLFQCFRRTPGSYLQGTITSRSKLTRAIPLFRYPIGGDTDYQAILIELHYDNPNGEIGIRLYINSIYFDCVLFKYESLLGYVDKLTIRYYMTKNLRKNELGILTLGDYNSR